MLHAVLRNLPTSLHCNLFELGRRDVLLELYAKLLLLLVGNSLHPQELLDTPVTIETTKSTRLRTTMRQGPFIMHRHGVNMDSSVFTC